MGSQKMWIHLTLSPLFCFTALAEAGQRVQPGVVCLLLHSVRLLHQGPPQPGAAHSLRSPSAERGTEETPAAPARPGRRRGWTEPSWAVSCQGVPRQPRSVLSQPAFSVVTRVVLFWRLMFHGLFPILSPAFFFFFFTFYISWCCVVVVSFLHLKSDPSFFFLAPLPPYSVKPLSLPTSFPPSFLAFISRSRLSIQTRPFLLISPKWAYCSY